MQFIEQETKWRLVLGAGTLYGALKTLDKKGWIVALDTEEAGSRKKEYLITPIGKEVAMQELERLKELIETAQVIMIGGVNVRKKVYKVFLNELDGQEKWLNEMADQGWELVRTTRFMYEFQAYLPSAYHYQVEFVA